MIIKRDNLCSKQYESSVSKMWEGCSKIVIFGGQTGLRKILFFRIQDIIDPDSQIRIMCFGKYITGQGSAFG